MCPTGHPEESKGRTDDLKAIYKAPTEVAAEQALEEFAAKWDSRYPSISQSSGNTRRA